VTAPIKLAFYELIIWPVESGVFTDSILATTCGVPQVFTGFSNTYISTVRYFFVNFSLTASPWSVAALSLPPLVLASFASGCLSELVTAPIKLAFYELIIWPVEFGVHRFDSCHLHVGSCASCAYRQTNPLVTTIQTVGPVITCILRSLLRYPILSYILPCSTLVPYFTFYCPTVHCATVYCFHCSTVPLCHCSQEVKLYCRRTWRRCNGV
jgi:hypothetical protein